MLGWRDTGDGLAAEADNGCFRLSCDLYGVLVEGMRGDLAHKNVVARVLSGSGLGKVAPSLVLALAAAAVAA